MIESLSETGTLSRILSPSFTEDLRRKYDFKDFELQTSVEQRQLGKLCNVGPFRAPPRVKGVTVDFENPLKGVFSCF